MLHRFAKILGNHSGPLKKKFFFFLVLLPKMFFSLLAGHKCCIGLKLPLNHELSIGGAWPFLNQ